MPKFNLEDLFRQENERLTKMLARNVTASREVIEDAMAFAWSMMAEGKADKVPAEKRPAWLFQVAKFEAFALLKGGTRKVDQEATRFEDLPAPADFQGPAEDLVGGDDGFEDELLTRIEADNLVNDIRAILTDRERTAITLFIQGRSYKEIMVETGWSYTAVNKRISAARNKLRAKRDERGEN